MPVVVQKYGGSSVADLDKLGRVADRIAAAHRSGLGIVVVVSAMGKTTEQLLNLANEAAKPPGSEAIREPEPPRRELDMLVSTGERVSMALLSIALHARGLDSVSFTGSQSGIITTDRHFDARIVEVRPYRIEEALDQGRIVIVAGYQGMSTKREITTLGRGGSDTTAVALAAALGAERCEIYSDVDGIYTADPRTVANAEHLPEVDYQTLQEMAESGAKVLAAQAVEWARRHQVELRARRTSDPRDGSGPARETVVRAAVSGSAARAVVRRRPVALLRARAHAVRALLGAIDTVGLPLFDVAISGSNVVASAPLTNVPDWPSVRAKLVGANVDGLVAGDGLAAVSLVGVDVGAEPALVARALDALPSEPMMTVTSPLRITCVTHDEASADVERRWHAAFVESG